MDFTHTKTWQCHQLASTEKMQREITRFTRPVLIAAAAVSLAYLAIWALVYNFWDAGILPGLLPLAAAVTGFAVVILFPAFALALGIEQYFEKRLREHENV